MVEQPSPIRIPDQGDPSRVPGGTTTKASDATERPDGQPPHTPMGTGTRPAPSRWS